MIPKDSYRQLLPAATLLLMMAGCAPVDGDMPLEDDGYAHDDFDGGVASTSAAVEQDEFCYLPSEGRGAGSVPTECPEGLELDGLLCYEPCDAGYNGVGPSCFGSCPAGYVDDGLTCRKDAHVVAKPSYGRGAGIVPDSCPSGHERNGALCYPRCASGYYGAGPVCWQRCPSGYHDDGATCRRNAHVTSANTSSCPWYDVCGVTFARGCSRCPSGYINDGCTCRRNVHIFAKRSYGRGAGNPLVCRSGWEKDAGLCYRVCSSGYNGSGPVCWGSCPAGYHDDGATCRKDVILVSKPWYGRGVGTSLGCSEGLEYDAGLCYEHCSEGYDGIGPVCWGRCPDAMVSCASGCADSAGICSNVIIDQVSSSLDILYNLTTTVLSLGSSTLVNTGVRAAISEAQRATLEEVIERGLREAAEASAMALTQAELEATVEALADAAEVGEFDPSILDPTGIAAAVEAFSFPLCY